MKKVITLVMVVVLLVSLSSCVVKNDSTASINNNGDAAKTTTQTTPNENASEALSSDILVKALDKAKSLDNCYYELIAEYNGNRNSVTKVWVKGKKTKIQSNDSDIFTYIDFEKGKFIDYDSKSKKGNAVPSNQNYIDDFNRYAGAYLANADYEMAISSLEPSNKMDIEGNSCIGGSYEDSTSKAKIYISEQYGVVMKFDFSAGDNKSLAYVTNLKVGSVVDQDVEMPQDAKISE